MGDCILTDEERRNFHELEMKAAKLRSRKVESEREFLDSIGTEKSQSECLEIEKRRRKILFELEQEGAKIESEYIESYRSKVSGGLGTEGGLGLFGICIFCEKCTTASCLSCIACSSCVLVSAI